MQHVAGRSPGAVAGLRRLPVFAWHPLCYTFCVVIWIMLKKYDNKFKFYLFIGIYVAKLSPNITILTSFARSLIFS